jgi:hypothetical protein
MKTEQKAHSEIGASGMKRWKNCPGSVALSRGVPNYSSPDAKKGTDAHTLAEKILIAKRDKKPLPDMMEYDPEDVDAVMVYVDHMISLQRPGCVQLYEHRFHLKAIHPDLFGTCDGVTYYPKEKLLVISDYKHGAGVFVDVVKNDQLLYYATGAVLTLGFAVSKVRIEIIQPRMRTAEAIRPWECDIFDIWEFADNLLAYAKRTEDPNAPLAAGEWCRWCPAGASNKCPLIKQEARALAQRVFSPVAKIDYDELEDTLDWLPVLETWISSTREFAYNRAMAGHKFKRHKIVAKRADRVFKNEDAALVAISKHTGIPRSELYVVKRSAMSPSQIEKIDIKKMKGLKKADLTKFLETLVDRVSSGFTLVHESDARPARERVSAKSVFSARRPEIAELT